MLTDELLKDELIQQFLENPRKWLDINPTNLSHEMTIQPALFARVASMYGMACRISSSCKLAMEVKMAQKFSMSRQDSTDGKPLAVQAAEYAAKESKEYIQVRQMYIDAEYQEMTIKAFLDGLSQKKDMLIQLGAIMRQEMNSNVSIMEERVKTVMGPGTGG